MRRLGTLTRIRTRTGVATIEHDEIPSIGDVVVDETLAEVGRVVDVIGPVDTPFAVIDPTESTSLVDHLDRRLYLREG